MCYGSCSKFKFLGIWEWDAHFLLHFCAIHAISSTSFWVGPLWFSALQLCKHIQLSSVHTAVISCTVITLSCMTHSALSQETAGDHHQEGHSPSHCRGGAPGPSPDPVSLTANSRHASEPLNSEASFVISV